MLSSSSSLILDLSDENILNKLLKSEIRITRRKERPITKIQIDCLSSEFWVEMGTSLSDDELVTIFTRIGHAFPHLREIEMKIFELPLPVCALNKLLQLTNDTLQSLEMEDVVLKGSQEEFEGLALAFQGHKALQKLHLDWCQPSSMTMRGRGTSSSSSSSLLDPVFHKLSTIQTLTQVKICGSVLSVASLRVLCSNQSLKRLSLLDDNVLSNDGMTAITEALESPKQNIRELCIRLCGLDTATGVRFANVLRDQNRTLEKLEIRIKDWDWNSYGSAFSDALKINNTLTDVAIYIDGSSTQVDMTAQLLITEALSQHSSLKSVRIALRGVGVMGGQQQQHYTSRTGDDDTAAATTTTTTTILPKAFLGRIRKMLQTNTCLERIQIDDMGDDELSTTEEDIQFFLRANRAGRRQLVQNPDSHNLWLQALIEQRHDVAFTYYLLSLNPTLCPKTTTSIIAPKIFEV